MSACAGIARSTALNLKITDCCSWIRYNVSTYAYSAIIERALLQGHWTDRYGKEHRVQQQLPTQWSARAGGRVSLLPHRISRNSSDFGFCEVTKVCSLSLSLSLSLSQMRTVSLSDQNTVFQSLATVGPNNIICFFPEDKPMFRRISSSSSSSSSSGCHVLLRINQNATWAFVQFCCFTIGFATVGLNYINCFFPECKLMFWRISSSSSGCHVLLLIKQNVLELLYSFVALLLVSSLSLSLRELVAGAFAVSAIMV
jgi:hypothetical protein